MSSHIIEYRAGAVRALLASLVLVLLPVFSLPAQELRTVAEGTSLRDSASISSDEVGMLQEGESVRLGGCHEGWCVVNTRGGIGFIPEGVLKPGADLLSVGGGGGDGLPWEEPKVELWRHANYKGTRRAYVGRQQARIGSSASSLAVNTTDWVTFYNEPSFDDARALHVRGPLRIPRLSKIERVKFFWNADWNDEIQSFRIRGRRRPGGQGTFCNRSLKCTEKDDGIVFGGVVPGTGSQTERGYMVYENGPFTYWRPVVNGQCTKHLVWEATADVSSKTRSGTCFVGGREYPIYTISLKK